MIALVEYNAWAEVVVAGAAHVYKIPSGMSFHDAAGFLMNFLTAYIMLFDVVGLHTGQSVLVHSVGGGVVSSVKTPGKFPCAHLLIFKVFSFLLY